MRGERFAAGDAACRLLLVQQALGAARLVVVKETGVERNGVFGAGFLAGPALDAGALDEIQLRQTLAFAQRRGRADRDTAHAQRAGRRVYLDLSERRARGQSGDLLRCRRVPVQVVDRRAQQQALLRRRRETGRVLQADYIRGVCRRGDRVDAAGVHCRDNGPGVTHPLEDRGGVANLLVEHVMDALRRFRAREHEHTSSTVCEAGHPGIDPDRGDLLQLHR
jgi:hypothetical protein